MNILDVPVSSTRSSSRSNPTTTATSNSQRRSYASADIPKGRPLSTSQIKSPKPQKPYETRHLYDHPSADELLERFVKASIDDDDDGDEEIESSDDEFSSSPPSSAGSSVSSRSASSASSLSDYSSPSTPACTCQRYGITRKGDRVKLDCGGSRCGYDDSSDCSSESDVDVLPRSTRQGILVRR